MIKDTKVTGFGQDYILSRGATFWITEFLGEGAIRILDKYDASKLVDVRITSDGKDIEVYLLPSTSLSVLETLRSREGELNKILVQEMESKNYPSGRAFTIDTDSLNIIQKDDFNGIMGINIITENKYIAFTFDRDVSKGGFPQLFVIPTAMFTGVNKYVFEMFYKSSRSIQDYKQATPFGKRVVANLLNSSCHGEYTKFTGVPTDLLFPTNGRTDFPAYFRANELEKIIEKVETKKKKKTTPLLTDGKKERVIDVPFTSPFLSAQDVKSMETFMAEHLKNKGELNLSDVVQFGLQDTMDVFCKNEAVVNINVNVASMCKKMCLYEGIVYVLPFSGREGVEDWEDFFGTGAIVIETTEESYPKFASGNFE